MRVAAGILLSKVVGLLRYTIFASYFGTTPAGSAFMAAFRIPNILQNLFGEGALSASFIPVYASLVGTDDRDEADRVAGAVFGLLCLAMAIFVALGIFFTPALVHTIIQEGDARKGTGFDEATRQLTVHLTRIIFPGIGLMVASAWCLGVLNSHRRFFLSYASPVVWNAAQILAMVIWGRRVELPLLAQILSWSVVAGSALQFLVQLPLTLSLLGRFRPSISLASPALRTVLRGMGPVLISRGVVQLSAYIDQNYSSHISPQAFSALSYTQTLTLLPISLFGMAVSASELPEMSQATGSVEEVGRKLRERINGSLQRIAFFVVPSTAAFLFLGDAVSALLFQHGTFKADDSRYVWYLLMGSCLGLLAQTFGRMYSSAFYALKDTRTPFYFALVRMALTAALAYVSVHQLPELLHVPLLMGGVGITATMGLAAWVEFALLRRALTRRIGPSGLPVSRLAKLWSAAALAGSAGLGVKMALTHRWGAAPRALLMWGGAHLTAPRGNSILVGIAVLIPFGLVYFSMTHLLGVSELAPFLKRLRRR